MPHPPRNRLLLAAASLLAFAGNSILCRVALARTPIDAASFTALRLASGAAVLVVLAQRRAPLAAGDARSALALFAYAAAFSLAYRTLPTGTGALLLFGAVQVTMFALGWRAGERPVPRQLVGASLAFAGLVVLVLPGLAAPAPASAALMLAAGAAWAVYTRRGRGAGDPLAVTAGNFVRTVPLAVAFVALRPPAGPLPVVGVAAALASGIVTSGLGYAAWYAVLPSIAGPVAATVQLAVPVLAAAAGVALLGEAFTARLLLAATAVLGGILLVVQVPRPRPA